MIRGITVQFENKGTKQFARRNRQAAEKTGEPEIPSPGADALFLPDGALSRNAEAHARKICEKVPAILK